ncbi:ferredoxin [Amycolatopsis nigrescens]|uniref:ferredoxin n=1 Tax=Amycolatopsis nigrescens TaxID=381445 RepID=UPI0003998AF2|nr:ferredoxin [Amycolatopsis nigrescens]
MNIVVDTQRCAGTGMCAFAAPEIFDVDDEEGTVLVRNPRPDAGQEDAVHEAVQLCPTVAIRLVED